MDIIVTSPVTSQLYRKSLQLFCIFYPVNRDIKIQFSNGGLSLNTDWLHNLVCGTKAQGVFVPIKDYNLLKWVTSINSNFLQRQNTCQLDLLFWREIAAFQLFFDSAFLAGLRKQK